MTERSDKKITKRSGFSISAKHHFLTYPSTRIIQRDDVREGLKKVIEIIKEKIEELKANARRITVGFETGQKDEESKDYEHLHVLVSFDRKVGINIPSFWDIGNVHGHYKGVGAGRSGAKRVRDYVIKDDCYEEWKDLEVRRLAKAPSKVVEIVELLRQEGIQETSNLSGAAEALYALHKARIDKAVTINTINFNRTVNNQCRLYQACDFRVPKKFAEWETVKHRKSLLLLGKSGTGKTSLALAAFKNALLVRNLEQLKELSNEHDGIVFDDVMMSKLEREEKIHLLDVEHETGWNIKFGTAHIPRGMGRVFTSNLSVKDFLGYLRVPEELKRRYICCLVLKDMRNK